MIAIGYQPLVTDSTIFSGGSWSVSLPLNNLKNFDLAKVARSTNALASSTKFTMDWLSAKSARVLSLVATNLSSSATIRWKRGTTSGGAEVYDSTDISAWPITPLIYNGKRHNTIVVAPSTTSARYDTVEIIDTSNPSGYIELGYAWDSDLFIPNINASFGLKDGLKDHGTIQRSESGSPWRTTRRKIRTTSFVLDWLSQSEADVLHELQRNRGTTEPVMFVADLANRAIQQRYGGVGLLAELSAIDYPLIDIRSLPLRWEEL